MKNQIKNSGIVHIGRNDEGYIPMITVLMESTIGFTNPKDLLYKVLEEIPSEAFNFLMSDESFLFAPIFLTGSVKYHYPLKYQTEIVAQHLFESMVN